MSPFLQVFVADLRGHRPAKHLVLYPVDVERLPMSRKIISVNI
jgi:hypothetical protein